jgi:tetraacyldisaccharide 4'-kinase
MTEYSPYRRIIAGETGVWASPVRAVLRGAEALYAAGVAIRNARYDRHGPRTVLGVPVISVGNLTAGGTGKTPFVIELVKRLDRLGMSPAVVSRGYRAAESEPNDEERLIRKNSPGVTCVSDPNRAAAAEYARNRFGADVIVLDDGFQHRWLGRDLDIVLIDATCPFGFGHLLPRGLLREPLHALKRAQVIALTRCDQVSSTARQRIESRLHELAAEATHIQCTHRVTSIERLDGTPLEGSMEGTRAVLFAAVGNPRAFVTTVQSMGVEVVGQRFWPDHHRYTPRDLRALRRAGRFPPYDLLITTEKDAVKLASLRGVDPAGIAVVRVAIDFVANSGTILDSVLEKVMRRS